MRLGSHVDHRILVSWRVGTPGTHRDRADLTLIEITVTVTEKNKDAANFTVTATEKLQISLASAAARVQHGLRFGIRILCVCMLTGLATWRRHMPLIGIAN